MAFITLENLTFKYPLEEKYALRNVSFSIDKGELLVIAGPSGCGKSTLLKMLKSEISPHGSKSGRFLLNGHEVMEDNVEHHSKKIGYVFQNPDNQIVSESVRSELIFGMENYGISTNEMRIRLAEIVDLFDLGQLLDKDVNHLSGGQKQLLNLASIMLLQPEIILLDEPTAQLDPIAAKELLSFVKRINEEFGITIILVEHRLHDAIGLADKFFLMDAGTIKYQGNPREVINNVWHEQDQKFIEFIPTLTKMFLQHDEIPVKLLPLTIKDARQHIIESKFIFNNDQPKHFLHNETNELLFKCENINFKYKRNDRNILNNLHFSISSSSMITLFGSNGAGKSTFLKIIAGIYKPLVGKILLHNKKVKYDELYKHIGYLPQQTQFYFVRDTIGEELEAVKQEFQNVNDLYENLVNRLNLDKLMNKHPHDCSGGELQKAAIACILLRQPKILLLDEPTKGLDPLAKLELGLLLRELRNRGTAIVMVSHDVEFAAIYSDECSLMFEGEIVVRTITEDFLKNNFYYTTSLERLKRSI